MLAAYIEMIQYAVTSSQLHLAQVPTFIIGFRSLKFHHFLRLPRDSEVACLTASFFQEMAERPGANKTDFELERKEGGFWLAINRLFMLINVRR